MQPNTNDEIKYFGIVVESIFSACNICELSYPSIYEAYNNFIDKVKERSKRYLLSSELSLFFKTFKEKSGVVITSCHKIKGEEYNTVIVFGILQGKIPHWEAIFSNSISDIDETKKMLYVIASRAKKQLYLIAE
jgi:DNA helicase-2/ATP-dependent DNA helicase PcrA